MRGLTSRNPVDNHHAIELQNDLIEKKIIPLHSKIEYYQQLLGGADTTIFEIGFENHPTHYIQRILRPSTPKAAADFEFMNQRTLFENGVNVPETYLINHPPNTYDRTYYVMKKIEGRGLNEILQEHPDQFEDLTDRFIFEMTKIHSMNPALLPHLHSVDIKENPHTVVNQALSGVKLRIDRYPSDLEELSLVVNWIEKNKNRNPSEDLVVIHGDYHPYNIIVDDKGIFHILDWTGIKISDFRTDLAFATVVMSAGIGKNLAQPFAKKYKTFTGKDVKNLEYFMVLSNVWNLLRLYSALNNPAINNEGEETLSFFKSIREYPLLIAQLVREECGIQLKQIEQYFSH